MKIMSYVFWWVPLSIKLRLEKKGTVVWPLVGMSGGSISSDCFGGFLDQNTTGKKGTVIWPSVDMSDYFLADSLLCFSAGSLIKLQIMTGKKVQSSGLLTPFATHVTFYFYYVCT